MKKLKVFLLINDIAFIAYWLVTLLHLIPQNLLFKDYNDPIMAAWNWSFFPLDMCVSFSGILSILLYKRKSPYWRSLCLVSLVLTFCSGLQAIAFWAFRFDFDLIWWSANLYLLIYPLFFIKSVVNNSIK
ncbi:MAG TPA: DUF5360 family protein [Clostridia bacterium]